MGWIGVLFFVGIGPDAVTGVFTTGQVSDAILGLIGPEASDLHAGRFFSHGKREIKVVKVAAVAAGAVGTPGDMPGPDPTPSPSAGGRRRHGQAISSRSGKSAPWCHSALAEWGPGAG